MKERPIIFSTLMVQAILEGRKTQTRRLVKKYSWKFSDKFMRVYAKEDCDHQPGENLWVRERFALTRRRPVYRADAGDANQGVLWRSPIQMPRWASRITLQVEDVRVERVQDISEADAVAEGCPSGTEAIEKIAEGFDGMPYPVSWFRNVWESIHGPGAWDRNDWVWAITFRRLP